MDAISINVSGRRYDISQQTFMLISQAMGARLQSTPTNFVNGRKEYFFERHADIFQTILYYYQTGDLHMPQCVCPKLYNTEMEFWGVNPSELSKCCYNKYWITLENYKKIVEFERYFTVKRNVSHSTSRREHFRRFCWQLMNDPFSSVVAEGYFWITMCLVVLNITTICLASHLYFQADIPLSDFPVWIKDYLVRHYGEHEYDLAINTTVSNITYEEFINSDLLTFPFTYPYLFELQIGFYGFFTVEFLCLILFCPSLCAFISSPLHLIDLLALVPFYAWLILDVTMPYGVYIHQAESILSGISILRVFRLLRLARRIKGLRILLFAIKSSLEDIFLLILMLLMATVFFASVMYYVDDRTTFPSILDGFWWAIVTMTTVGYGDQVPKTAGGKLLGSFCAIVGVIIVALTVPVFVSKFQLYYTNVEKPTESDSEPTKAFNKHGRISPM